MRLAAVVLAMALSMPGCLSIDETCRNPRPMAGTRTYFQLDGWVGRAPWMSVAVLWDMPLSFLMDLVILPYTWGKPVPEPEVEEAW